MLQNEVRNVGIELWYQEQLMVQTLVTASNIQQENLLTVPMTLQAGLNFLTLKTHGFTEDEANRKLGILVEKITFIRDLNGQEFTGENSQGVREKVIVMDGSLKGTGWFPWETIDGVAVRWMEKVGSVWIEEMDVTQLLAVEIRGKQVIKPQVLERLRLKVNGREIAGEVESQDDGRWQLQGRIWPGLLRPQAPFVLSLHAEEVHLLSAEDGREASVLVEEVLIQAVEPQRGKEWVILMDETLLGTGWYPSENRQAEAVRWMQKVGSVVVEGVETDKPLQLQIQGVTAVERQYVEQLQVQVNGAAVEGTVQHQLNGQWLFEGYIPPGVLPVGLPFLLTLLALDTQPLSESDTRCVSLLIAYIVWREMENDQLLHKIGRKIKKKEDFLAGKRDRGGG